MNLSKFKNANLFEAGTDFFKQLGINLQTNTSQSILAQNILKEHYKDIEIFNSIKETYYLGLIDDSIFSNSSSLFDNEGLGLDETLKKVDEHYDGIMVFAINLYDYYPSRTDIALLVRAFNKSSKKVPVILLLNYKHYGNSLLTFAASERNKYQQTWRYGEKLGKISMLRDIDIEHTHTGHLKILQDLKLRSEVGDFEALHKQWIEVFDVQLLNKRFYQDISNWYFWALQYVDFPEDAGSDKDLRNATSLIRLLTRIIFVWFLKEKHLVPEELFDKNQLENILDYKDKNSSTFYKAVLQNLFFATLNTPMKKDNPKSRIFIDEAKRNGFVNDGYLQSGYFRYKRFIKNPELFLDKFSSIPFLNGGLFECLDDKIDGKEIRIDCFSDNPKNENKLKVPDVLFFSDELQVDLNNIYDTRNRSYSTKGLIKILNSYKFTITENTPIEEEIALDPELLGKVFENLLASYNPETGTTARKATGSFYTPREIVNYMVDESIIAYLEQKLVEQTPSSVESNLISVQEKLRQLVSYTEQLHQFEPNEVETLINAIENLKILDPACGSGAFPMGVLHKLVLILHKLDPDNKIWLQKLIDRTPQEIREETRKALANKPLDYIRKLGLIENCIYGVDIQPIAIQIAKLRFFISLIVEQKIDDTKENRDIKPLPNLETKFVAANTLIGLEKDNGFKTPEVENAENELFRIRKDIFYSNSLHKKKILQTKEKTARQNLKNALLEGSFNNTTAEQIASWDPFDQNTSASWFDPEWMFGVKDGFDIVIGNPPYIQLQKAFNNNKKYADLYKNNNYQTFERTGDIYCLFYEKGIQLLKENGLLTYITSNKWMRAGYGEKLREFFIKYNPLQLVDLGPGVFENATVDTNILLIKKVEQTPSSVQRIYLLDNAQTGASKLPFFACTLKSDFKNSNDLANYINTNKIQMPKISKDAWFIGSDAEQKLKEKIEKIGKPLKDWDVKIYRGVLTGLNEAFIITTEKRNEILANCKDETERRRTEAIIKPILRGRDIKRYHYEWAGLWVIVIPAGWTNENKEKENPEIFIQKSFPSLMQHLKQYEVKAKKRGDQGDYWWELRACAYYPEFEKEKVVYSETIKIYFDGTKNYPRFCYDDELLFLDKTTFFITGLNNKKYLLGFLNSKVSEYLLENGYCIKLGSGSRGLQKILIENLPLPPITPSNEPIVKQIEELVDKILAAKKQNPAADISQCEREIDELVYRLYDLTEEEVKIIEGK